MTFELFGLELFTEDAVGGFWLFNFKGGTEEYPRSLLGIYYYGGDILIDLFWMRIYER